MFVKICGITNRDDAMVAVEAGAGAVGFIFAKNSPRFVTPESVSEWIGEIPPQIWKVGVYVDETPGAIERISGQLQLDVAQLHGKEALDQYPSGIRVWKAIRVNGSGAERQSYPAEAVLLDGPGSGRTFDWSLVDHATRPFVLAGGLTPENVRQAIDRTQPWGVDTASGVESSPGRKDHAKVRMFIRAALQS